MCKDNWNFTFFSLAVRYVPTFQRTVTSFSETSLNICESMVCQIPEKNNRRRRGENQRRFPQPYFLSPAWWNTSTVCSSSVRHASICHYSYRTWTPSHTFFSPVHSSLFFSRIMFVISSYPTCFSFPGGSISLYFNFQVKVFYAYMIIQKCIFINIFKQILLLFTSMFQSVLWPSSGCLMSRNVQKCVTKRLDIALE